MAIKHSLTMSLLILLCTGTQAQTQVYETTDADGNPVFSDSPTKNSQTVEIEPTNIADRPPAAPAAAAVPDTAPTSSPGAARQGTGDSHVIVNSDYGSRLSRDDQGDGFVTKHTPDGDIIVNEREQERALKEEEEYFTDRDGVRRIRVRKSSHRGKH
jgi:hypothetical protein